MVPSGRRRRHQPGVARGAAPWCTPWPSRRRRRRRKEGRRRVGRRRAVSASRVRMRSCYGRGGSGIRAAGRRAFNGSGSFPQIRTRITPRNADSGSSVTRPIRDSSRFYPLFFFLRFGRSLSSPTDTAINLSGAP